MKICSKCGLEKDESCFSKSGKGYLKSQCKFCDKQYRIDHKVEQQEYDRQYYQNNKKPVYEANKPLFKEKNAKYYQENKEEILDKVREYATDNSDKIKENKKQYYEENKEIILENQKVYYKNNFDQIRITKEWYRLTHKEERNKNSKNRYDNDPVFKLRVLVSSSVLKFLKNNGSSKDGESSIKHLSYTIQELKEHLEKQFEPWMTWDNQGKYDRKTWDDNDKSTWTWQIDHIIPHSSLPYINMNDDNFKKCWALENLRPYSAKQNLIDGNRRK